MEQPSTLPALSTLPGRVLRPGCAHGIPPSRETTEGLLSAQDPDGVEIQPEARELGGGDEVVDGEIVWLHDESLPESAPARAGPVDNEGPAPNSAEESERDPKELLGVA
jgi:hypothetical protein